MDENQDMKRFADQLWDYFKPRIEELTRSGIWYFRAQVTKEAENGKITVQRPFDGEIALPYISSMANAAVGSQVTVFVLGSSMTNAVICGNGSLSILGGTPNSGDHTLNHPVPNSESEFGRRRRRSGKCRSIHCTNTEFFTAGTSQNQHRGWYKLIQRRIFRSARCS